MTRCSPADSKQPGVMQVLLLDLSLLPSVLHSEQLALLHCKLLSRSLVSDASHLQYAPSQHDLSWQHRVNHMPAAYCKGGGVCGKKGGEDTLTKSFNDLFLISIFQALGSAVHMLFPPGYSWQRS